MSVLLVKIALQDFFSPLSNWKKYSLFGYLGPYKGVRILDHLPSPDEAHKSLTVRDEIGATGKSRRCPDCGVDVNVEDVLCVNCGFDFRAGTSIGNLAGKYLLLRRFLFGLGVIIAAAIVYNLWPKNTAPGTPPPTRSAPAAPVAGTAPSEPDTPPEIQSEPQVPVETESTASTPDTEEPSSPVAVALERAEELASQVAVPVKKGIEEVKAVAAETFKSKEQKHDELRRKIATELDAKVPMFKAGDEVELRGLNGQIIRGEVMWMRSQSIVLLTEKDKLELSLKALDRHSRLRCDKAFRANLVETRLQKFLQQQEAKP